MIEFTGSDFACMVLFLTHMDIEKLPNGKKAGVKTHFHSVPDTDKSYYGL